MERFEQALSTVISKCLGLRCTSYGSQYSEIIRSLMPICLSRLYFFLLSTCNSFFSAHLNHLLICGSQHLIAAQQWPYSHCTKVFVVHKLRQRAEHIQPFTFKRR